MKKAIEPLHPGTHVRTPYGLAWVNYPPIGEDNTLDRVFVRLGDNTTRWIAGQEAIKVD